MERTMKTFVVLRAKGKTPNHVVKPPNLKVRQRNVSTYKFQMSE
jgi:hypothetical protein